jgi:hypothetical protein
MSFCFSFSFCVLGLGLRWLMVGRKGTRPGPIREMLVGAHARGRALIGPRLMHISDPASTSPPRLAQEARGPPAFYVSRPPLSLSRVTANHKPQTHPLLSPKNHFATSISALERLCGSGRPRTRLRSHHSGWGTLKFNSTSVPQEAGRLRLRSRRTWRSRRACTAWLR